MRKDDKEKEAEERERCLAEKYAPILQMEKSRLKSSVSDIRYMRMQKEVLPVRG